VQIRTLERYLARQIWGSVGFVIAGFLALFAPGGIGVREGLFILMLQGPLGIGAATALAVASRLLLTLTELGAAVPFLLLPQGRARVAP